MRIAYYNERIAYNEGRDDNLGGETMNAIQVAEAKEAKRVLDLLRVLGTEEQRIAYAVLEGMRLQKALDSQNQKPSSA
mgnify:CR=1 FL=1